MPLFPSDIKFGARYSYIFTMNTSSYETMTKQGLNVEAAASYSGFGFSVNAEASMSQNQKDHSTEFNKHVEVFTKSVGSAISKDGDATTWASEVKYFPVPMEIHLLEITSIFFANFEVCLNKPY